jgi:hypothetical protein
MVNALEHLKAVRSLVIDGELVACDAPAKLLSAAFPQ